jgi:hypothetical protein
MRIRRIIAFALAGIRPNSFVCMSSPVVFVGTHEKPKPKNRGGNRDWKQNLRQANSIARRNSVNRGK